MPPDTQAVERDHVVEAAYNLANRIVGILAVIVGFALVIFAGLLGVSVYLLFSAGSGAEGAQASVILDKVILPVWDKLVPLGSTMLHVVAPVIILLLAIVVLRALSRTGATPFDLSRLLSDLPSVIALLIVATICLLPLAGIAIPDVLNNVALVVVGFYFGKHKTPNEATAPKQG